jgi:hypothetical protein
MSGSLFVQNECAIDHQMIKAAAKRLFGGQDDYQAIVGFDFLSQ